MVRRAPLQHQVLALYRQALRLAKKKAADGPPVGELRAYARAQFEQHRSVGPTNIMVRGLPGLLLTQCTRRHTYDKAFAREQAAERCTSVGNNWFVLLSRVFAAYRAFAQKGNAASGDVGAARCVCSPYTEAAE